MSIFSVGWEFNSSTTTCVMLLVCSSLMALAALHTHGTKNLHSVFSSGLLNSFIVAVTIHLFLGGNMK